MAHNQAASTPTKVAQTNSSPAFAQATCARDKYLQEENLTDPRGHLGRRSGQIFQQVDLREFSLPTMTSKCSDKTAMKTVLIEHRFLWLSAQSRSFAAFTNKDFDFGEC